MSQPLKKVKLKIHGMHCASCEVLIERKFKKIEGVEKVSVNHGSGKAEVLYSSKEPYLSELNALVKQDGYSVSTWEDRHNAVHSAPHKNTSEDYLQMGGIVLVIVSIYYILKQFNLVPSIGISAHMSYGVVFLIGLFAATSTCIAVVGGLLLAVAGKYNESHPDFTGIQKFKPHIWFNTGRILGYSAFGALVGGLGSVLTLSARANGFLIVLVSLVMLLLGFQLLNIFPGLRQFSPKMPKFIGHKIHDLSTKETKGMSFALGASTFFLPCGFTQALQLYVLATGDWKVGALTMLVFALGTLPALLSLSAIASFAKGVFQKRFLKFAGVLVVLLALFNINNGLTLAGFNLAFAFGSDGSSQPSASLAQVVDGKQIVKMAVRGYSYEPSQFTVVLGVPVLWQIDGGGAVGCGQVLVMPTLGISKYLSKDAITTITFTPTETGAIPFNCSMGMMTRGSAFTVVPNTTGVAPVKVETQTDLSSSACDPKISTCIQAQQVSLEISRERGFYPQAQTIKSGVPVLLTVDDQVDLGGCMGTMTIPEYGVAQLLKIGKNVIKFTPTHTGTLNVVCSMGVLQTSFNVI